MRVLFASTQGAGHFGPLIPFIDACTRCGHETLIVGPPALKARGYEFRAGAAPPDEILGPLWGRMPSLPPAQGDLVVVGQIFAGLATAFLTFAFPPASRSSKRLRLQSPLPRSRSDRRASRDVSRILRTCRTCPRQSTLRPSL